MTRSQRSIYLADALSTAQLSDLTRLIPYRSGEHDQVACDQIGRLPWGLDDLFLNGKIPTDVPADDQLRKKKILLSKKIGNKNVRTGDR